MSKQDKIFIRIEPEFGEAFRILALKRDVSTSALGRDLILQELESYGLIPTGVARWSHAENRVS